MSTATPTTAFEPVSLAANGIHLSFGANAVLPKQITDFSDQIVEWDGRALVDAIKSQARHEESNRWDTIEFKLD